MRTSLKALLSQSLKTRGAEPATWVEGASRAPLVPLARVGIAASDELNEYVAAAEQRAFREAVAGLLHLRDGQYWNPHPVRSPTSLLFRLSPAQVTAFLAGLQPLAEDPDSGAVLVASWGRGKSTSMVASFLFNDVSPADEHRGDFVFEARSLRALFAPRAPKRPRATAAARALEQRYQRGVWLGQLLFGADFWVDDPEDGTLRAMQDAASLEVYRKERRLLATNPDLAAYWLLSHAILEESGPLEETLRLTRAVRHPVVIDLHRKLRKGPKDLAASIIKHRDELPDDFLQHLREAARR